MHSHGRRHGDLGWGAGSPLLEKAPPFWPGVPLFVSNIITKNFPLAIFKRLRRYFTQQKCCRNWKIQGKCSTSLTSPHRTYRHIDGRKLQSLGWSNSPLPPRGKIRADALVHSHLPVCCVNGGISMKIILKIMRSCQRLISFYCKRLTTFPSQNWNQNSLVARLC